MKIAKKYLLYLLAVSFLLLAGCGTITSEAQKENSQQTKTIQESISLEEIPDYSGDAYVLLYDNVPSFSEEDKTTESFETYAQLDELGRCGVAFANIGEDLMPTEKRGQIGSVKPSGWQIAKYDFVDGKYLYNRCHLIGYQLTAENANEKNLITGTRYLNIEGMLSFENMVADYIKDTGNHVLYRVTPIFEGDNLIASGVQMEGWSVEDDGEGICFNAYAYNVQPGVTIDYATGNNAEADDVIEKSETTEQETVVSDETASYVINTNTKKFHQPDCNSVDQMKEENKEEYTGSRADLIEGGYEPCQNCNP